MPVISKKFATELSAKEMRDAFLDAQTRTKLAQQIRALRNQRSLSQEALGKLLGGKPQGNVARLEDRDIGRYTLTTLLELASAFNVGIVAKFVPYCEFLRDTENLAPKKLEVQPFSESSLVPLTEELQGEPATSALDATAANALAGFEPLGNALVQDWPKYASSFVPVSVAGLGALTGTFKAYGQLALVDPLQTFIGEQKREDVTTTLRRQIAQLERERDALKTQVTALTRERDELVDADRDDGNVLSPSLPAFVIDATKRVTSLV